MVTLKTHLKTSLSALVSFMAATIGQCLLSNPDSNVQSTILIPTNYPYITFIL